MNNSTNSATKSLSWSLPHCPNDNNWSINWSAIAAEFGWFLALANSSQCTEFNLPIQMKIVCEALVASSEWRALPNNERSQLFAAALIQNLEENSSIISKSHVSQSVKMAQRVLWDLNVPFAEREAILALVKYGSLPLWFWDKPNPEKSVIRTSQFIRCDMLAMLAEANIRGRKADHQQQLFERINLFREFALENQCLYQPRQFDSNHSRFVYFQKEDGNCDYCAYDDTYFQVVIMSGLPGSGKDTWIRENLLNWKVISLDELRLKLGVEPDDNQGVVANAAKSMAKEYMKNHQSFVWNATNISSQLRERLVRLFTSYQAKIRIVYLEASWEELLKRNRNRTAKVPEKILDRMRDRLEVPKIIEAHEVEFFVSN